MTHLGQMTDKKTARFSFKPNFDGVPAPVWAKNIAENAAKTLSEEFTHFQERFASNSTTASDADTEEKSNWRARLMRMMMESEAFKNVEPERVAAWIEQHGSEIWLRFMLGWEKVSRQVVDEIVTAPAPDHKKTRRAHLKALQRWEGVAKMVISKAVDLSLDTPEARRARRHRDAKSE